MKIFQFLKPYLPLFLLSMIGIALSLLAHHYVNQWEQDKIAQKKKEQINYYIRSLRQHFLTFQDAFAATSKLYEVKHQFVEEDFKHFMEDFIQRRELAAHWIAWSPKETQVNNIWETNNAGTAHIAAPRAEYFPIRLFVGEGSKIKDFDLNSLNALQTTLNQARADHQMYISPVIATSAIQDEAGFFFISPVYKNDDNHLLTDTFIGYLVAYFPLKNYFETVLRLPKYKAGNFLRVLDLKNLDVNRLLYVPDWYNSFIHEDKENIDSHQSIDIGGHLWQLEIHDLPDYSLTAYLPSYSNVILMVGICLTFSIIAYLNLTLNYVRLTEDLVTKRTLKLHETNLALNQEMQITRQMTEELEISRQRFRAIFDEAAIGILQTKLTGEIVENNKAIQQLLGYSEQELHQLCFEQLVHPEDRHLNEQFFQKIIQSEINSYRMGKRLFTKNRRMIWAHINCSILRNKHESFLIYMIEDVTEHHYAEIARLEAELKYRQIYENAIEGIFQCMITGQFLNVNPAFLKIFGYDSLNELNKLDRDVKRQIHYNPDRYDEFMQLLMLKSEVQSFEYQAYRKNNEIIWVAETVRVVHNDAKQITYYEGFLENITERKQAEEKLRYDASHDQLTGLLNRTEFTQRANRKLKKLHQTNNNYESWGEIPFAILFVDLDHFKIVNDSMGHLAGDKLLREVAQRLRREIRGYDVVARFGGDEFAIMLENLNSQLALKHCIERLTNQLTEAYHLDNEIFNISFSIGIAIASRQYLSVEEMLRDADIAMYEAKKQGRGKAVFYEQKMHNQVVAIMRMQSDLRKAFENEEFCLFYQPIISLENRHTVSLEALLRWQHPQKGLISPDKFIPVAEEMGLINELGLWVFKKACSQLKVWQQQFEHHQNLGMNINVSMLQLRQPRLVREISDILQKTGINPHNCRVEITESAMMQDPELMMRVLHDLKCLEVQLYVDDFGTGYSSLSYLQKFPLDALKIDKSFIQEIDSSEKSKQITRAIIALGKAFDLRVVAEGVENETQIDILQSAQCHHVQGYYFSRPKPEEDLENYLQLVIH